MEQIAEKLTPKQVRFLACLLSEPSIEAAAQKAGCGHTTAFRWLSEPAFAEAYRQAQREAVSQATGRIQAVSGEAVEVLRQVMNDAHAPKAARVSAARTCLEFAYRAIEHTEITERLERLEAKLEAVTGAPSANGRRLAA